MTALRKLFKQTFIYGLATVLPRILSVGLVPLYVSVLGKSEYGIYAALMAYLITGNVLLSYGMETAFFRFINKSEEKAKVQSTALTSLAVSAILFLIITLLFREQIAFWLDFKVEYITYAILILVLDALVVIPFAWYRNQERPVRYSVIKIVNVVINLAFNLFFFLLLPYIIQQNPSSFWEKFQLQNKVSYVFIANLIASAVTLLIMLPLYIKIRFKFDVGIWKKMFRYAFPVLVAGIAFSINEAFDKILLKNSEKVTDAEVGVYAACYKLGVFMTLFATAFRLGVEPFFFRHAHKKNAKETYAKITQYFTVFGTGIFLTVVVFIDIFKRILIPNETYWVALSIVPVILLANLCLGIYHNLSVWYKITDKTKYGAYISVFGAIITLGLNIILIPIISYEGSALATLAAYGSMMIISYVLGQKKHPIPYNLQKIGLYLFVSTLFSYLSFYIFDSNLIIGTLFLFVFLMMIYFLERKELSKILKKSV